MQERDSNQGAQPEQREREYGESSRYAGQGELNEGYGQAQDMAEDEWSGERYHQQAERLDRDALDRGEPRTGESSDVDQMVGGMTGVQPPSDVMGDQSRRQEDTDVMGDRPERGERRDELQG